MKNAGGLARAGPQGGDGRWRVPLPPISYLLGGTSYLDVLGCHLHP